MFPKLKAVIEIEKYDDGQFKAWEILPTKGIYFIELSGKTSLIETGTVIYRLADYQTEEGFPDEISPKEIFQEIIQEEKLIIPGGLQAVDTDSKVISPGCCCGLESWREWFDVTPSSAGGIWPGS